MIKDIPISDVRDVAWSLALALAVVLLSLAVHHFVVVINRRALRRNPDSLFRLWTKYVEDSVGVVLPCLGLLIAIPWFRLSPATVSSLRHTIGLVLIAVLGWRGIRMVRTFENYVAIRHPMAGDNLQSRRLGTQVQVLRHIATFVIVVLTISIMLMTFPNIRHLGESLFASAGLAAVVGGLAARSTLTNLMAGVQIALTQPIRLEDVVIVEGEWGWIEEITTTYVVVRIWDLRRLVLPLAYFIEKPFQNWTRRSADILGTVFLYADYTVPVNEVREEFHRILEASGMWDGKVWGLQVTNLTERTVELRALMSAPNSPQAWDLRCHVREKLILFLQERYPNCLPRTRAEIAGTVSEDRRPMEGMSVVA